MTDVDQIVREFLVESHETLDQVGRELVALEQEPQSHTLLDSLFCALHTIKGTSGSLGYSMLERLVHAGESVLSHLRDGAVPLTEQATSALLRLVDAVGEILGQIATTGGEGALDHSSVTAALAAVLEPPQQAAVDPDRLAAPTPRRDVVVVIPSPLGALPGVGAPPLGQMLVQRGATGLDAVTLAVMEQGEGDARPLGEILVGHGAVTATEVVDALDNQAETKRIAADNSIRVEVRLLDGLIRLLDELDVASAEITSRAVEDPLSRAGRRLEQITGELRQGIRTMCRQPVDSAWGTVTRLVRELSLECGKDVRLQREGGDIPLDRTILDAVRDPLIHCVRNAIDHGLESAPQRVAAGKPAAGTLLLRASVGEGHVSIEVTDDGRGIDPVEIGSTAVERGLVRGDQLDRMSEREILRLVLLPGFSTSCRVTRVTGRGVGLDVVRSNVEQIGGSVDVCSAVGRWTTIRLTIPLTAAD